MEHKDLPHMQIRRRARRKRIIAAGAVTALAVVAVGGVLLATNNAQTAGAASRQSYKTAGRADNVVRKLDTFDDANFAFPTAFGNDFFVSNPNEVAQVMDRPVTSNWAGRYQSRYFDMEMLNKSNPSRMEYMERLDNLYALCADISAVNAKQNTLVREIREETMKLRGNAAKISTHKVKAKQLREFNRANDTTKDKITRLHRDRNSINKRVKALPKQKGELNVHATDMRYTVIMDRLDMRVQKLEETKAGLVRMNASIEELVGYNVKSVSPPGSPVGEIRPQQDVFHEPLVHPQTHVQRSHVTAVMS